MNEQTLSIVQDFQYDLQQLVNEGKSLRDISQITYNRRESGENIPYMAIGSTKNGEAVYIYASPTVKQKELRKFFSVPRRLTPDFYITLCIQKHDDGTVSVDLKL